MPESNTEKALAQIWSDLLQVDLSKIGRHSSFFEMGGDSISAIQLVTLCKSIDIELNTVLVFKKSTLSQMASLQGTTIEKKIMKELVIP